MKKFILKVDRKESMLMAKPTFEYLQPKLICEEDDVS